MQEAALAVVLAQAVDQVGGKQALGGAQGVGVPFGAVAIVHADEGGLAAHGQSHIAFHQGRVHCLAQRQHIGPLRIGVRLGDTW